MDAFSLREFHGGLNTAVDESNIPATMTASLANVDFLDSRAIRVRRGYVTQSEVATARVHAVNRYYQKDGDSYWVAVCGTAAYMQQVLTTHVPLTTIEAEDVTPITGSLTETSRRFASGGKVGLVTSASLTMAIPYSTALSVRSNCGTVLGASLSVDGAAYVNASGPKYSFASISATAHVLKVKPTPRNASSMRLSTTTSAFESGVTRNVGSGQVSIKFYDGGGTPADFYMGVSFRSGASDYWAEGYGVTINTVYSTTKYVMTNGSVRTVTNIDRSTGWHTVTFERGGRMTLDGEVLMTVPYTPDDIHVECYVYYIGGNSAVFDSLAVNGVVIDDMDSVSGWSTVPLDTYAASASVATYADIYDSTPWMELDSLAYSALGTFTARATNLTATSNVFGIATMNDALYIASAYDALQKSTGGAFSAVTASGTTTGAYLIEHRNRLFSAGDASDPSLLRYSALDKAEVWDTSGGGGSIYFAGKDSGGNCTGLVSWNDILLYFSESKTYALDTSGEVANWSAKTLSTTHGCIAPRSVAAAPNGVIFLSGDGVRSYGITQGVYADDGSAFAILSDNITPTLESYTDAERKAALGCIYNNRYWLAIGDDVYVCDLEKRIDNQPPWTHYTGFDIGCFFVDRADNYALYAGSKTDGTIYRLDYGGSDNGEAIPLYYRFPPVTSDGYTSVKHFRHLHIAAESEKPVSVLVTMTTDDVSPPAQSVTFDELTSIQPRRLAVSSRGRSAQIEIQADSTDQDLTISELTLTYNPAPRMR